MPDLRTRITEAIKSTGLVGHAAAHEAAIAVIRNLGLTQQKEKSGVGCPECDPIILLRWVTGWEVVDD